MATSQNGWTVNPSSRTDLIVNGVEFGGVRSGDVFTVLAYVAGRFAAKVERLIPGQCGAYNPRKIEGSSTWSNHASATAIDCNWGRHPRGRRGTFLRSQEAQIRDLLDYCDGVVRWGGDFTTTVDEMHFEIHGKAAAVKALADKIKGDDVTKDEVKAALRELILTDDDVRTQLRALPWQYDGRGLHAAGTSLEALADSQDVLAALTTVAADVAAIKAAVETAK